MEILGIVNAFITFTSLLVNLIACGGTSTTIKKVIIIQWIIGLLLMIGCEGYAIYLYLTSRNEDLTNFKDQMVLKVLVLFIAVNLIDFFFWLIGLRTLTH